MECCVQKNVIIHGNKGFSAEKKKTKDISGENVWWNMVQNKELNASCKYSEGCQIHRVISTVLYVLYT